MTNGSGDSGEYLGSLISALIPWILLYIVALFELICLSCVKFNFIIPKRLIY